MNQPVRISFRQNGEYLMAGQNEVNALDSRRRRIPPYIANTFIATVIVVALVSAAWDLLREGAKPEIVSLSIIFALVIGALWLWLFKKIGLYKSQPAETIQETQKDVLRYREYHKKLTGEDEIMATWEFDDVGVRLINGDKSGAEYVWSKVTRTVERASGFLIFIRAKKLQFFPIYLWFPRDVFANQEDYNTVRRLLQSAKVAFETSVIDSGLLRIPKD